MSSWTMEAIINMRSMSSVYEQESMQHMVCMEHRIVILPRDNPVCVYIETDHGIFDVSGLHQIPNCSQDISEQYESNTCAI